MTVDVKELSGEVDSLLRRNGARLISIEKAKIKAKAKSSRKRGNTIKCDLKIKAIATDGEWVGKINIKFKVAGVPAL